jgi:hypothetical protein
VKTLASWLSALFVSPAKTGADPVISGREIAFLRLQGPNIVNNLTNINIIYPRIRVLYVRWLEGFWDETLFHVAGPRGMYMDDNRRHFSDLKGANAYAARVASELAQDPIMWAVRFVSSMNGVGNWTACR